MNFRLDPLLIEFLYRDLNNNYIINGGPGTGKTLLAIYRAIYHAAVNPKDRILFAVPTNNLKNHVEELLEQIILESGYGNIKNIYVNTVYSASKKFLGDIIKFFPNEQFEFKDLTSSEEKKAVSTREKNNIIKFLFNEYFVNTPYTYSMVSSEIARIQNYGMNSLYEYYSLEGVDGNNLSNEIKNNIYNIYTDYLDIRKNGSDRTDLKYRNHKYYDFNDMGSYIKKVDTNLKNTDNLKYNKLILDGFDNINLDTIYSLETLLREDGHIEMYCDPSIFLFDEFVNQKKTNINFKVFETYHLENQYRCTYNILKVANKFINNSFKTGEIYTTEGEKPKIAKDSKDKLKIDNLIKHWRDENVQFVFICNNYDISKEYNLDKNKEFATYQTCKGLEYDIVLIPTLSEIFSENINEKMKRELYLAITRAKKEVIFIITDN